jgi:hypothetical protein
VSATGKVIYCRDGTVLISVETVQYRTVSTVDYFSISFRKLTQDPPSRLITPYRKGTIKKIKDIIIMVKGVLCLCLIARTSREYYELS